MQLENLKKRLALLEQRFNNDPSYVLAKLEDGTEVEVTVDELLADAYSGKFSMSFVRMKTDGKLEDAVRVLETFDLSCVKIFGDPGALCSDRVKKWYESMTPDGELCVLPGCAHNASRERPQEFNAVVDAFADRVSGK